MKNKVLATLLVGVIARIELASFAGHPFDLSLFTYSSRLYYETGHFDTFFPALPILYYVQLAFYSLYVLLRDSGFTDLVFMYHSNYIVEGLFLRIPLISGAWGTYDSLMMLPLVYGFILTSRNQKRLASVSFAISGLIKLFGFVPFGLLALENLFQKRFKEFALQLATFTGLTFLTFTPYLQSGLQDFYSGFVLRFVGLSGAQTRAYNVVAALSGLRFTGTSPFAFLGIGAIAVLFILQARKSEFSLRSLLLWSIVAAVWLDIFSQSEPQWLSWLIPMSILYAHLTNRVGLASYSYFYGAISAFLSITLLQSVGYLPLGTPLVFFSAIEAIPNTVLVYAITVMMMLLTMLGYVFFRPVRFRIDVVVLISLVYLQAYFWFSLLRIVPF
ncbi:hypothetical protein E6H31_10135 [Candidatus Bathyarchaeota archaeon]|nr:MAG: hypothetical protein E6H31_10135 [Candidatus Bathyarchaeota archaeon]